MISLYVFAGIVTISHWTYIHSNHLTFGLMFTGASHSVSALVRNSNAVQPTPAQNMLAFWIATYDTGDIQLMRQFASEQFSDLSNAPISMDVLLESWDQTFRSLGPLRVGYFRASDSDRAIAFVKTARGVWWRMQLQLNSAPHPRIVDITLTLIGSSD